MAADVADDVAADVADDVAQDATRTAMNFPDLCWFGTNDQTFTGAKQASCVRAHRIASPRIVSYRSVSDRIEWDRIGLGERFAGRCGQAPCPVAPRHPDCVSVLDRTKAALRIPHATSASRTHARPHRSALAWRPRAVRVSPVLFAPGAPCLY